MMFPSVDFSAPSEASDYMSMSSPTSPMTPATPLTATTPLTASEEFGFQATKRSSEEDAMDSVEMSPMLSDVATPAFSNPQYEHQHAFKLPAPAKDPSYANVFRF